MTPRAPLEVVDAATARSERGARLHTAHTMAQADLYLYDWHGQPAVLKDFSSRPWLVRIVWSRAIAARELRALARLQGLEGIPKLYARAGREAYIMQRLDATPLPSMRAIPPPREFWKPARALLDAIHEAGVAHGDVRRKNIMVGQAGEPYFIDFATAMYRGKRGAAVREFLYRHVRRIDRITFARIKNSYAPDLMDETELTWLADEPLHLRIGRWLKRYVYRLRKWKYWKRWLAPVRKPLRRTLRKMGILKKKKKKGTGKKARKRAELLAAAAREAQIITHSNEPPKAP